MAIPRQIGGDMFKVGMCIGSGGFGDVYGAKMKDSSDVAIKFEPQSNEKKFLLSVEFEVFKKLKGESGFPKLIAHGKSGSYNFLAMQLLGESLKRILKDHDNAFSLHTVQKIGVQMLERLEVLHGKNVVHCDIKPDNIMIGRDDRSILYLSDFGLAMPCEEQLNEPQRTNAMRGSLKYMSVAAHNGIVSFQSDIESLAYMLLEMYGQKLPWEGVIKGYNENDSRTIYRKVLEAKMAFDQSNISLPKPLQTFLSASKNVGQLRRPNYRSLKSHFK